MSFPWKRESSPFQLFFRCWIPAFAGKTTYYYESNMLKISDLLSHLIQISNLPFPIRRSEERRYCSIMICVTSDRNASTKAPPNIEGSWKNRTFARVDSTAAIRTDIPNILTA